MKYLLLLRFAPGVGPEEGPELEVEMKRWGALNEEMQAAGVLAGGAGLALDSATTVRVAEGDRVLTDGPFAETKEVLFSYYLLDLPDLDAAVDWAAKMPCAAYGSVEVRPLSDAEQG